MKARGYDIPNDQADGMDVMKVYEAAQKAIETVRSGKGPFLLEFKLIVSAVTRWAIPNVIASRKKSRSGKSSDPIGMYRKYLTENKITSVKSLDEMDEQVMDEVQKAVEFAEASPEPTMEDLYKDVYADA